MKFYEENKKFIFKCNQKQVKCVRTDERHPIKQLKNK